RYNLMISASEVRGQTVRIVARRGRGAMQAVEITLLGRPLGRGFPPTLVRAPLGQDFDLTPGPSGSEPPTIPGTPGTPRVAAARVTPATSRVVDSAALGSTASTDVAPALAGRVPGLVIT